MVRLPDGTRLLTAPEVAKRMGVHRATVARWAKEGQLPVYMRGPRGEYYFREADLAGLLIPASPPAGPRAESSGYRSPT